MVMECCYCGKKVETNDTRTFHRFPLKQPQLLQLWLDNMCLGPNFKPSRSMRLCSDHFSEQCFQKSGVNITLSDGSIPTLFGTYKLTCVFCSAVKTQEEPRSFYRFPRNPIRLQKWLAYIGEENYTPSEMNHLCSDHFEQSCFRPSGYKNSLRLKNDAVPTILQPAEPNASQRVSWDVVCDLLPSKSYFWLLRPSVIRHAIWFPPAYLYGLPIVGEKRKLSLSQELSSTKKPRPSTECEKAAPSKLITVDICQKESTTGSLSPPRESVSTCCELSNTPKRIQAPSCNKLSAAPTTLEQQAYGTKHDHQYESTPRTTRKKYVASKRKVKTMQNKLRVHKQKIKRLRKKISLLKDIVSELRRTRALPDSGLACLDSIAEDDVSQFLKRYMKNHKNSGRNKPSSKKRQWKSQRKDACSGISREKYPAGLRSFAITLHFYSPKAYGFVRFESYVFLDKAGVQGLYSIAYVRGNPLGLRSYSWNEVASSHNSTDYLEESIKNQKFSINYV